MFDFDALENRIVRGHQPFEPFANCELRALAIDTLRRGPAGTFAVLVCGHDIWGNCNLGQGILLVYL